MKQIKDLASKVFGMEDEEVQSLFEKTDDGETLRDDAVDLLLKRDAQIKKELAKRIKDESKPEQTAKFDEGYSKAKKEERKKFEDEVRQKFGVDSDKMGVELIEDIVSQAKGSNDIKTHPDYLKLERQIQSDYVPKSDYETVTQEYQGYKQSVEKEQTVGRVLEDARRIFREAKPVLSKDPKRAAKQEEDFLNRFRSYDYEVQDDGNHLVIKNGKRLENENMNAISFPELVKSQTVELFDIQEQETKGGAGFDTAGGSTATWKTTKDFYASYAKETDPTKRVQMMDTAKAKGLV